MKQRKPVPEVRNPNACLEAMRAPQLFGQFLLWSLILGVSGCGHRLAPTHPSRAGKSITPKFTKLPTQPKAGAGPDLSSLFPSHKSGWAAITDKDRKAIGALASDYLAFLRKTQTQADTAREIAALAKAAGAIPFDGSGTHKAGELLLWQDAAKSSLALLKIGELPVEEGMQIIIASTDGAMIRLTPAPVYEKSGLALFDTTILGKMKVESWLNTPLVLDISVAQANGREAKRVRIGDDDDEPVFTIPDLLPHLSRKVQRSGLIDTKERLDALAAFSRKALIKGLKSYGIRESDWNRAEALLLPAQEASYVGVDRALIAAANHASRAFPFAATKALVETQSKHTTLVILMGHNERSYAGADAEAHIVNLLPMAIAEQKGEVDALDLRRIYARSKVMLYDNEGGKRNHGVVLNARKDDSSPEAFSDVLRVFEKAKVQFQIVEESGWSEAREISSHDIDAVEVGLSIAGVGTPSTLLSTLDLYQGFLACEAWVRQ